MCSLVVPLSLRLVWYPPAASRTPKPPTVEELLGPLDQARRDSALASAAAVAVGSPPQVAAALTVVATQRGAHARALATEIARAAGKLISSTSETSSSSVSPSPTDPRRHHRRRQRCPR